MSNHPMPGPIVECPNCEAKMNQGESCPECDHVDHDSLDEGEWCQCEWCQYEYYIAQKPTKTEEDKQCNHEWKALGDSLFFWCIHCKAGGVECSTCEGDGKVESYPEYVFPGGPDKKCPECKGIGIILPEGGD